MQVGADAKRLTLTTDLGAEAIPTMGDAARLRQVFWNLLSNAIKFTDPGGAVAVELRRNDSSVEVEVRDNGSGIPGEFLPLIFKRFTQVDSSMTRIHGGLGLGLAIVRHLVELHGGTVAATSEGAGRGASLFVRFPLSAETGVPHEVARVPQPRHRTLEGRRVLIVEDDPSARELMTIAIRNAGAVVRSVPDAQAAISEQESWRPDIIVSDLGMPEMDGAEMMLQIRKKGGQMPAIAVSAYAGSPARDAVFAAGFDAFVAKPFVPDDLIAAVRNLLR